MRFRNIAGAIAAGALALTPLATMATASASTVAAATAASTVTGDWNCSYSTYKLPYAPTVTATNEGGKIKLALSKFPGITGVPASITVKTISATATATIDGKEVTLTGTVTPATAAPLADGYSVPTLEADLPAGVKGGELSITGLKFDLVANAFGREMAAAIGCDQTAPLLVSVPTPPNFSCTYSTYSLGYSTGVKGSLTDGQINVAMDTFPGITGVPASITVKSVTTKATVEVAGKTAEITGTETIATPAPLASGFAIPAMSGAAPSGVTGGKFVVKGLNVKLVANAFGREMEAEIPCTDGEEASFEVAKPPVVTPPAPAAKKTTTKITSAKVKAKKVTVKGTVKAGKTKVAGKATVVIKKGKKTVFKKTVTVKKGAFSVKSKNLKKGTHKVTVSFKKTKSHKASSKSKSFKVK